MSQFENPQPIRNRGVSSNPKNRFDSLVRELEFSEDNEPIKSMRTQYIEDPSQSILSRNQSPDLNFNQSLNPYRGCEHGCAYCYARPTHEYLGYSSGLDFESRILFKPRAAELLESALSARGYKPETLAMSGVTDPYQPVEKRMGITRNCLEVLARCHHPVSLVTKNAGLLRDLDLFQKLDAYDCVSINLSITTLDRKLARMLEPRTSSPQQRLDAVTELSRAGIPTGVLMGPVIPGLTDEEMPRIFEAARDAGARWFRFTVIRLPHAVKSLFQEWLRHRVPGKADRVLDRIQQLRGGRLYDAEFGVRMTGQGIWAEQFYKLHRLTAHRLGFEEKPARLCPDHFLPPSGKQMELF